MASLLCLLGRGGGGGTFLGGACRGVQRGKVLLIRGGVFARPVIVCSVAGAYSRLDIVNMIIPRISSVRQVLIGEFGETRQNMVLGLETRVYCSCNSELLPRLTYVRQVKQEAVVVGVKMRRGGV